MTGRSFGALTRIAAGWRLVVARLPQLRPISVARRLVAQANAARDGRLFEMAASLYEEALRVAPGNPRFHIQCGHMWKEARQLERAEAHYQRALQLVPNDADLALQLGHFFTVAGRLDEAEAAYRRARALAPGGSRAVPELSVETQDDAGEVVPELLPSAMNEPVTASADVLRILRLGTLGIPDGGSGTLRTLRGVEAIRGYCVAAVPVFEVRVSLDGREVARAPTRACRLPERDGGRAKYVFNLWHDFSGEAPGRCELVVRLIAATGRARVHRQFVRVAAPFSETTVDTSDNILPPLPPSDGPLEERINALPSMVRPAERTPLPAEIHTILVQRLDQLGDLVCSVPAIRRLRELFPAARLIGLLTAANAELGSALGLFDEVITAELADSPTDRRRCMTAEAQLALRRKLTAYSFDLAIDLGEGADSRPVLLLSGARFMYGFGDRSRPWLSAGFTAGVRDAANGLEIAPPSRKLLAMVEVLGTLRTGAARPLARAGYQAASMPAPGLGAKRPFVVLHTGARLPYSRWPGFPELARLLLARSRLDVVVLADDPAEELSYPASPQLRFAAGRMPFAEFDALLAAAAVFVGNDSGPKHLAALRGTPVVSLHMARLNWNEWGQEITGTIISRRVPCAGCAITDDGNECGKDFACLRHIRAEEVFNAVLAQLGQDLATTPGDPATAPPSAPRRTGRTAS